ncbi:MAG: MarR family transcriptional regulator [Actinobacteria bacterium]|nr:MarR family transcriptional regulator [Actinomycetota bacterium]
MPEAITPTELAAYATLKRAIVSIRLNLGKQMQQLGGISLVQFEILFMLEQSPDGLRMHELAEAVGVTRSGLTYQIGQMEQAGWVQRIGSPTNARAVTATLTDAGLERVARLQEQHLEFVRERAFGLLSEDELAMMTSIFRRIAAGASGE